MRYRLRRGGHGFETPGSQTENASSEVIQESNSEVDTQSAAEEEEPAEATAEVL